MWRSITDLIFVYKINSTNVWADKSVVTWIKWVTLVFLSIIISSHSLSPKSLKEDRYWSWTSLFEQNAPTSASNYFWGVQRVWGQRETFLWRYLLDWAGMKKQLKYSNSSYLWPWGQYESNFANHAFALLKSNISLEGSHLSDWCSSKLWCSLSLPGHQSSQSTYILLRPGCFCFWKVVSQKGVKSKGMVPNYNNFLFWWKGEKIS